MFDENGYRIDKFDTISYQGETYHVAGVDEKLGLSVFQFKDRKKTPIKLIPADGDGFAILLTQFCILQKKARAGLLGYDDEELEDGLLRVKVELAAGLATQALGYELTIPYDDISEVMFTDKANKDVILNLRSKTLVKDYCHILEESYDFHQPEDRFDEMLEEYFKALLPAIFRAHYQE